MTHDGNPVPVVIKEFGHLSHASLVQSFTGDSCAMAPIASSAIRTWGLRRKGILNAEIGVEGAGRSQGKMVFLMVEEMKAARCVLIYAVLDGCFQLGRASCLRSVWGREKLRSAMIKMRSHHRIQLLWPLKPLHLSCE